MSHEWREQAACKDADINIFFVPSGASLREARSFCERCPVVQECLDDVIYNPKGDLYGFRGNKRARERRAIRYSLGIRDEIGEP